MLQSIAHLLQSDRMRQLVRALFGCKDKRAAATVRASVSAS